MFRALKSALVGLLDAFGIESGTDPEPSEETNTNLYQCSDCGTVYVAAEKQTCSGCQERVTQLTSGSSGRR